MLTFEAEKHEYRWNGVIVPSVTQILSAVLGDRYPETAAVERAKDRGTIVHETIALDLAGDLDEESVDPQVAPYLAAARLFCRECEFKPTLWETRRYSVGAMFAGTVDAANDCDLVDWKTGGEDPAHAIQTAAYAVLLGIEPRRRLAVYLRDDGQYRIGNHTNFKRDRADFLTLRAAFAIKERMTK